jgi:hypothetical protein
MWRGTQTFRYGRSSTRAIAQAKSIFHTKVTGSLSSYGGPRSPTPAEPTPDPSVLGVQPAQVLSTPISTP